MIYIINRENSSAFVWNNIRIESITLPFDVKRTTGYRKVHGKVSGKERSHEQGSLHVSARSLIKTGQRNKEARHAIGPWYRNEVNRSVEDIA